MNSDYLQNLKQEIAQQGLSERIGFVAPHNIEVQRDRIVVCVADEDEAVKCFYGLLGCIEFLQDMGLPKLISIYDRNRKRNRLHRISDLQEFRNRKFMHLKTMVALRESLILPTLFESPGSSIDGDIALIHSIGSSNDLITLVDESTNVVIAASRGYCRFTRRSPLEWFLDSHGNKSRWDPGHLQKTTRHLDSDGCIHDYEWKAALLGHEGLFNWYGHFERLIIGDKPVRCCKVLDVKSGNLSML